MMSKDAAVLSIERHRGTDASVGMSGNISPIVNLPESSRAVREAYNRLHTRDAQREFFRSGFVRTERDTPSAWARLYLFLELCREEEWYWRERGHNSFEAFWSRQGQFAIGEFAKLEAMFGFAKIACPNMHETGELEAAELWRWMSNRPYAYHGATVWKEHTTRPLQGVHTDRCGYLLPEIDYDLQSDDYRRGFDHAHGGSSSVRRFRRLKRLAPAVAQEVLQGKFVRVVRGKPQPDLARAEDKAGIIRQPADRKSRTAGARLATRLSKLSGDDLNEM